MCIVDCFYEWNSLQIETSNFSLCVDTFNPLFKCLLNNVHVVVSFSFKQLLDGFLTCLHAQSFYRSASGLTRFRSCLCAVRRLQCLAQYKRLSASSLNLWAGDAFYYGNAHCRIFLGNETGTAVLWTRESLQINHGRSARLLNTIRLSALTTAAVLPIAFPVWDSFLRIELVSAQPSQHPSVASPLLRPTSIWTRSVFILNILSAPIALEPAAFAGATASSAPKSTAPVPQLILMDTATSFPPPPLCISSCFSAASVSSASQAPASSSSLSSPRTGAVL